MLKLLGICFICVIRVLFGMGGGGSVVIKGPPKTPRPPLPPKGQSSC